MSLNLIRSPKAIKTLKINVLGVDVSDISQKKAIDAILNLAQDKVGGHYVVTVNAEFIMLAKKNREFAKILQNADLAVTDGWWVAKARLMLGGREQNRLTGVDLVQLLCTASCEKAIRIGFLGGFGDVAKRVSERQKLLNRGLSVVFAGPGDPAKGADSRLKGEIGAIGRVDILFVAYGMGQQEFWIARNREKLDVGVFIGVGGAFDYLAGVKKRAPKFLQKTGFEWLWRLAMEPSRIGRQAVLPVFLALVTWQILVQKLRPIK